MGEELTQFDRRLLDAAQRRVPLVLRPFEQLAAEIGAGEAQVLARLAELSGPGGIVREISAVFEPSALGYSTTLAAAEVDPGRLDAAAAAVGAHPGVSHCYGREGPLKLWFTLALGGQSRLGMALTLEVLRRLSGSRRVLSLPAVRRYKLHVRFDLTGEGAAEQPAAPPRQAGPAAKPTAEQVRAIRALQQPLAMAPEPFDAPARAEGLEADMLLVHGADFLAAGWMRRYAAALRHRQAGAAVNVLAAWQVSEAEADAVGRRAAGVPQVSHCYLRQTAEGWPYNLYAMIHGRDRGEVDRAVEALSAGGAWPHVELPTTREFKKTRLRLFSREAARWEAQMAD